MGGAPWTTPEERAFLKLNIKQFEAAQEKKKTSFWISQFMIRFLEKFEDYSNGKRSETRAQIEKVSVIVVIDGGVVTHSHRACHPQRIRAWYNNHSGVRNREPSSSNGTLVKAAKAAKAPESWFLLPFQKKEEER